MTFLGVRRLSRTVVAQSQNPRVIPVAEAKVYVNPTKYMLANLQREIARDHFFYARALRIGEDCYFWVSDLVTHSEVVKDLGLAGKVTGIVEFPAVYLTKWGDPNAIIEKAKHWTFGPGDPGWTAAKRWAKSTAHTAEVQWVEDQHPRDEDGQFASKSVGVSLDQFRKDLASGKTDYDYIHKDAQRDLTGDISHIGDAAKRAISAWTDPSGYKLMNGFLREQNKDSRAKGMVEALDAAIASHPLPNDAEAYRGIHEVQSEAFAKLKPGDQFFNKGYVSTTLDPKRATHFARGKSGDVLHYHLPKGFPALYVSHPKLNGWTEERELLLPHGYHYRYDGTSEIMAPQWGYDGSVESDEKEPVKVHEISVVSDKEGGQQLDARKHKASESFTFGEWKEDLHPRGPDGQFIDGNGVSPKAGDILEGAEGNLRGHHFKIVNVDPGTGHLNVEFADPKTGLTRTLWNVPPDHFGRTEIDPDVVEVGGNEWNRQSAIRLESEYAKVSRRMEMLAQDIFEKKGVAFEHATTEPKTWDDVGNQDAIFDHWKEDHHSHFYDEEVSSWQENGEALNDAKWQVSEKFNDSKDTEWAEDALEGIFDVDDEENPKIPFTLKQIIECLSIEYEGDGADPKFDFNNEMLSNIKRSELEDPNQPEFSGFEKHEYYKLLTDEMRESISEVLKPAYDEKAEKASWDMEPPDFLEESVQENMDSMWSEMDDSEKFDYGVKEDLIEAEEEDEDDPEDLEVEDPPKKYDPLNETDGSDYKKTQAIAQAMSVARAEELVRERLEKKSLADKAIIDKIVDERIRPNAKFMPGLEDHGKIDIETVKSKAEFWLNEGIITQNEFSSILRYFPPNFEHLGSTIANMDKDLWKQWKGSSTSIGGKILQVAAAEELNGHLREHEDLKKRNVISTANSNYREIGGYEGIKAYVRAKWETTQFLLKKAGIKNLNLYRGVDLPGVRDPKDLIKVMKAELEVRKDWDTGRFYVRNYSDDSISVTPRFDTKPEAQAYLEQWKKEKGEWTVFDTSGTLKKNTFKTEEEANAAAEEEINSRNVKGTENYIEPVEAGHLGDLKVRRSAADENDEQAWIVEDDKSAEVFVTFPTKMAAEEYAEKKGWDMMFVPPEWGTGEDGKPKMKEGTQQPWVVNKMHFHGSPAEPFFFNSEEGAKKFLEKKRKGNIREYRKLPNKPIIRNGLASTTTDPSIANSWGSSSNRVVLRASVPRTSIVSIPAYGINVHSEHEVVVAGTAWGGWDAWYGKAPTFEESPMTFENRKIPKSAHVASEYKITNGYTDDPVSGGIDLLKMELDGKLSNWLSSVKHEAAFEEDAHPRGEGGMFIPAKPGTTPIPPDHVRLYHQTKEENLEPIRNEGLNLQHSRTDKYSDPAGIWADEKGWHGDPSKYPTVEFSVPKDRWRAPFVVGGDVRPEDIVAIHYPWHGRARYIEENPKVLKDTLDGKHDDLLNKHHEDPQMEQEYSEYANAIRYIKNKYGAKHEASQAPKMISIGVWKIYRNPPKPMVKRLIEAAKLRSVAYGSVRLIESDGDIYAWDGMTGPVHSVVIKGLGLSGGIATEAYVEDKFVSESDGDLRKIFDYAKFGHSEKYGADGFFAKSNLAASTPSLIPAIRWRGKIYRAPLGGTHEDALAKIPEKEDRFYITMHGGEFQVYVNQNGRVFDRRRAFDYAVENDLVADWAEGPFLIAEELMEYGRHLKAHVAGKVLNTYKCKVFIDPNKDQMRTLYNSTVKILADHGYDKTSEEYYLRMLLIDGHLFVWEGWFEIHKDMVNILKSQGFMIPEWEQCYVTVSDMESIGLDARKLWSSLHPRSIIRTSSIKQTAHGKVVINPPKQQWANVAMGFMGGESRILEKDGVFYIWDAGADGAIHYQIALDLGLEAPYKFTMIRKWEGEQIGWDYHRLNELGPHLWHKGKDNPLKHGHLAKVEIVNDGGEGAKVFVDPSRAQVKALSDYIKKRARSDHSEEMRLMRNGGHIYLWDGMSLAHILAVRRMALPGVTETRIAFPIDLEGVGYDAWKIFDRKGPADYDIELGEDGRARILGGMNVKGADLRADIIARGAPAVRYKGRVYAGLRGTYHALICAQNNLPGKSEVERGYVIGGKFIPDDSLPQGIDSSELMTNLQKLRVDQDLVRDWRSR